MATYKIVQTDDHAEADRDHTPASDGYNCTSCGLAVVKTPRGDFHGYEPVDSSEFEDLTAV